MTPSGILALVVLATVICAAGMEEPQAYGDGGPGHGELDLIILAGQSNMAGRGGVYTKPGTGTKVWDGIVPPESEAPGGRVLRLNAALKWEPAREPLHRDIDLGKVCGIGPGLTFAAALVNHESWSTRRALGLVPCAKGATSIREWSKGSHLYNALVKRTKAAMGSGKVKALLWYQGESDTLSKELADEYKSQLETFIKDVRSSLGCPDLPFIQVGITASGHPYTELLDRVREAQREVTLPKVFYVDAQGLELQSDGVHLTTKSQVRLGQMLADSYLGNVAGASCH